MNSDVMDLPDVEDAWAWMAACDERGWGDGLPTVPPTEERVAAMLAALPSGVPELGPLPPRGVTPTVRSIAANAVMAGCRPADLPVLLAAVAAVQDEAYNLHGSLATTHPCAPMVMVSGPARDDLGLNSGGNCLGQGTRGNAVIGRALSLVLTHVGGATPGVLDRSTQGSPAKYTFCFAEADSPFASLAEQRGFAADDSVVSVMAAEPPHNVNDHGSTTGAEILLTVAGTMAQPGSNNVYVRGPHLLLLGPEHAATLARDGWTPASIRAHLWEHARIPDAHVSEGNRRQFVEWGVSPDGGAYTVSDDPENLHIAVAGGAGKHSAWIPSFGGTELVSRAVPR